MPLPPALLERLKRRKIIQETSQGSKGAGVESDPAERPSTSSNQLHDRYVGISVQEVVPQTDDQEEIIAADYSDEEKLNDSKEQSDTGNEPCGHNDEDSPISDQSSPQTCDSEYGGEEDHHKSHSEDLRETDDMDESYESVIGCPNKYNIYHNCNKFCKDHYAEPDSIVPSLEQRKHLALILRAFPMTHEWLVVYDPGVKTFYFWNTVTDQVSWFPPGMSPFSSPSADHIRRVMSQQFEQIND